MPSLLRSCSLRLLALLITGGWSALCSATQTPLSQAQCQAMLQTNTISASNPVPCERLTQVGFSYIDFAGQSHHDGKVVVLDAVAPQVQAIFDTLLAHGFPLQQAQPLENFQGDDEASMQANNSSAFNGRPITGGTDWSKHAYGVAIDINPLQNPYLSRVAGQPLRLLPPTAAAYLKRLPVQRGMAEQVRTVFFQHGFLIWGGNWHQPVDYQHFEIGSRKLIAQLLALSPAAARQAFDDYVQHYAACIASNSRRAEPTRSDTCAKLSKR